MDVLHAAMNLVHDHPGGAQDLGPKIGKAGSTLSHEVNPQYPHAKLGLLDALKLSVVSGNRGILNAFAAECGCLVLPMVQNAGGDGDTLNALGAMAREFGELVAEVSCAMADGRVSDNEMARVETEAGQLMQALQRVVGVLKASNMAGRPELRVAA
jgi:hypothetical protein